VGGRDEPGHRVLWEGENPVAGLVPAIDVFGSDAPLFLLFLQEINSGR
jgi:hypothetical protein